MHPRFNLMFGALATLLLAQTAGAHPRMIAYGYSSCMACHENPLGSRGMLTLYGNGVDRAQSYFNEMTAADPPSAPEIDDKSHLRYRFQIQLYAKAERQLDPDKDLARMDVFPRVLVELPLEENLLRLHTELGLSSDQIPQRTDGLFEARPGRSNLWVNRALLEFRPAPVDEKLLAFEAGLDFLPEGINVPMGTNPARNFDLVFEESVYSQARFTLAGPRYLALLYIFGPGIDLPAAVQQKGAGALGEYYALQGRMALGAQFRGSLVSNSIKLSYGPFLRLSWKERWACLAEIGGTSWSNLPPPESTLIGDTTQELRSTLSVYYHIREWLVANAGYATGYNPELDSRRSFQIFGGVGARISPQFSIGLYGRRDTFDDGREPSTTIGIHASAKY